MTSIRRRLLLGLLALVLVVDGLAGLLSYRSAVQSVSTLLDYQLRQMALSLRDQGETHSEALQIPAAKPDLDFVIQIRNADGALIYASRPAFSLGPSTPPGYSDIQLDKQSWRMFALQTEKRVVVIAQPWTVRKELAGATALRALAPLLILTPLLALAIWFTVIRTLAPIGRAVRDVQQRDADSLEPVATRGLPVEIQPLVIALNRLLERLAGAFEVQRAFISDAAHELRSPLTALRLQLQLLGRAPDESARSEAAGQLGMAIERANALVQQLLTLARNEPGTPPPAFSMLDLHAVVREAMAEAASLAVSREIELELQAGGEITIEGDADSLRVLARNLVDNAIRYTPRGGRVIVNVIDNLDAMLLQVEDSGPGIAPDERARVFDRFHRAATDGESGTGLGLAIVQAVARRHHASIDLGESALGGLSVSVRLPKRMPSAASNTPTS